MSLRKKFLAFKSDGKTNNSDVGADFISALNKGHIKCPPFLDYFLPHAAMMLKQGFGRLIRTQDDVGIVAVLDPRMKTRSYGRFFLETLPECLLAEGMGTVEEFLGVASLNNRRRSK